MYSSKGGRGQMEKYSLEKHGKTEIMENLRIKSAASRTRKL